MAEINELVARLRGAYSTVFERSLAKEAADLIESQERDKAALAARIAELEGTIARHDHAKGEAMSRMERTLASVQAQIQWMKDNPNVGVAEVFKRLLDAMTDDMVAIEQDLAAANAKFAAKPDVAKLVERVQSLRAARHEWEGASSTELLLLDAVVEALLSLSAQLAEKEANLAAANAALRECRQHADVMADVPGSIAANLAAERYRAWRAKIDAAIAAKEKP